MVKFVYEVLEEAGKARAKADKVRILKENESWALKDVLRGSIDSTINWWLPKGEVPYTPSPEHSAASNLLKQNTKFVYFVKGSQAAEKLPQFKRERIFLGILEAIHPEDAKLLVKMINKEAPKGITKNVVMEAFPGLIRE
jgi:hypothetical protein